jgi:hypothetical protein
MRKRRSRTHKITQAMENGKLVIEAKKVRFPVRNPEQRKSAARVKRLRSGWGISGRGTR